jgi:hypothetical protein
VNWITLKGRLSFATVPTASGDSQCVPRRASSAPPASGGNSAPVPHRSDGGDAGATFIGGVMGGMLRR